MEQKHRENHANYGRLPAMAPLANPYVPFQAENPPKYEHRKGLVRGTMFPGLDLPFMGMVNKNELQVTPKSELQALGFALHELALYLDTHREDKEALEMYRQYQKVYHAAMMEYSRDNGPISHNIPNCDDRFSWLDDPWPWEYSEK